MPNHPKTPAHTVRVPDELWAPAVAVAAARGETISDAIRQGLTDYVAAAEEAEIQLGRWTEPHSDLVPDPD